MEEILVINSGSSSLKFALFGAPEGAGLDDLALRYRGHFAGLGSRARLTLVDGEGHRQEYAGSRTPLGRIAADLDHDAALSRLLAWIEAHPGLADVTAIGHRIVHGGSEYRTPLRLDAARLAELEALVPLAPLHQSYGLAPVRALKEMRPRLPQVACFDTAFHATQPAVAQAFPLPRRFTATGMRRYGFHGLSYDYINRTLPRWVGSATGRTIVAHLGNGASLCAIRDGESVASTMGFTALDGLMMGTRSGSLDPGLVLHLILEQGLTAERVQQLLYKESGLLGVSGISGDMRELLASSAPEAAEAIELFVYRIVREIGSLAAALGGLDHLVFTAGIGERAAPVRAAVVAGCAWLGATLDPAANVVHATHIAGGDSRVGVWVIPTDEERMIAWHTVRHPAG